MSSEVPTFVVLTLRDTLSPTLIRHILTPYIIKNTFKKNTYYILLYIIESSVYYDNRLQCKKSCYRYFHHIVIKVHYKTILIID